MNTPDQNGTTNSPYTVAVDIDGVLYKLVPALRRRISSRFNRPLHTLPNPGIYDLETAWNLPKDAIRNELITGVQEGDIFWTGAAYRAGLNGLRTLRNQGYHVVLLSARDLPGMEDLCYEATEHWLKSPEVDAQYDELHLVTNKTDAHFDFLVDDFEYNVRGAHAAGRGSILMRRYWNASVSMPQASWRQIPSIVSAHRQASIKAA